LLNLIVVTMIWINFYLNWMDICSMDKVESPQTIKEESKL